MPLDDRIKLARGFAAASAIRSQSVMLQTLTGTVAFNVIRDPIDQIFRAFTTDIAPLIAFGSSAVNASKDRHFPINSPANTYAAFTALQTALAAFFTAYKTIYDGAGNVMTFTGAGGHQFISVNVSALSSLATPLANVVAACDPLVFDA